MNLKNNVIIEGRLTNDVVTSQTPNGTLYCNFSVAVDRSYRKDKEREADFINCTAWGATSEFISKYFEKGKPIIVQGELRNRNYTDKNGVKHFTYVVNVNNVDFPLTVIKSPNETNESSNAPVDVPNFDDIEGFNPEDFEDLPY